MQDILSHTGMLLGHDVFVVGAGPSLREFDFQQLRDRKTIVLNDMIFAVPEPDYHLFADITLAIQPHEARKVGGVPGAGLAYQFLRYPPNTWIVCQRKAADWLRCTPGFSAASRILWFKQRGPDCNLGAPELWCNHTVSATAIYLAFRLGAKRVFLLGCDGYKIGEAEYYNQDPGERTLKNYMLKRTMDNWDHEQVAKWLAMQGAPDFSVYNLSAASSIDVWPKEPLEYAGLR